MQIPRVKLSGAMEKNLEKEIYLSLKPEAWLVRNRLVEEKRF